MICRCPSVTVTLAQSRQRSLVFFGIIAWNLGDTLTLNIASTLKAFNPSCQLEWFNLTAPTKVSIEAISGFDMRLSLAASALSIAS